MKKLIIFISIFITTAYLSSAVNLVLNSGEKLDNSNWISLSSVLNKVDISGSNININGKLAVNGKICDTNNNCLGECETDYHWENTPGTCINNTKFCNVTNGTGSQIWSSGDWGNCDLISCDYGYEQSGNTCVAPNWDCEFDAGEGNNSLLNSYTYIYFINWCGNGASAGGLESAYRKGTKIFSKNYSTGTTNDNKQYNTGDTFISGGYEYKIGIQKHYRDGSYAGKDMCTIGPFYEICRRPK